VANPVSIANYTAMFAIMETEGIGAHIRRRRDMLGLTQKALADRADTSSAYISQIEGGKVALPGVEMRRRIANALGESQIELLIAAGEIDRSELETAGLQGVSGGDWEQLPAAIQQALRNADWTAAGLAGTVTAVLALARGVSASEVIPIPDSALDQLKEMIKLGEIDEDGAQAIIEWWGALKASQEA
jgi:transcriptional regulator with XRE-family HTH domain